MCPERFDHFLGLIKNSITKEDTNFCEAISTGERLAVTLHFLASGELQQSLSFAYLIGKSTLSRIIRETRDAMFESLSGEYLPASSFINRRMGKYYSRLSRDMEFTPCYKRNR